MPNPHSSCGLRPAVTQVELLAELRFELDGFISGTRLPIYIKNEKRESEGKQCTEGKRNNFI